MTTEQIEQKYPDLFTDCFDFSIGEGWMPLVDVFCSSLQSFINRTRAGVTLGRTILAGKPSDTWNKLLPELEKTLNDLEAAPPKIVQIKEKFGNIRIYCHNLPDELWPIIGYIENLSSRICEDCGKPAEVKTTGWIRTLCEECAVKSEMDYRPITDV